MPKTKIESRKKEHVELVLARGAQYKKTTGLEAVDFIHNALPEIALECVDLSTKFLGKRLKYPILIAGMTGGYEDAGPINWALAETAQKYGLAFGVGSQRAMIEKPELAVTYQVRKVAPDIPLLANIGAFQLKRYDLAKIEGIVSAIEADALAIHLNPLQESIQPEGDTDFSGVLEAISKVCDRLSVPVMVKETGAGMSQDVAIRLKAAGAKWLDISGSGGTSWSTVEYMRDGKIPGFDDWGIPTLESLMQCKGILPLVASGGIRSGLDGAKTIALGADMCGAAYPFISALRAGELDAFVQKFIGQMRVCAFLSGSKDLASLRKAKLAIR